MAGKTLYLRFGTPRSLLEQEAHLSHGGLFVPVPEPAPTPLDQFELCILGPLGDEAALEAQVVQIAGGGMALTFEDPARAGELLMPMLQAAREKEPESQGKGGAEVSWERPEVDDGDAEEEEAAGTLYSRIKAMSTQERMRLARHGTRPERLLLMKDLNRTIHTFLLQNPRITLDEVRHMAGNRQTGAEVLEMIAKNREWMQIPGIVQALVRNPKTATPTAIRLLDKVPVAEIRRLAKSNDVRRPISMAARKRLRTKE
jgi:hypothetical protein